MIDLVISSSEATGSLNGQEERDMMFSRLFGLTSISQSGLIVREVALLHTSSAASTLQDYQRLITELISLGEFKSWFRESCWWSMVQVIAQISASTASFRSQALEWTFSQLFIQITEWTPEKVGVWLRFHSLWDPNASIPLRYVFKGGHILSPGSLPQLAQILKVSWLLKTMAYITLTGCRTLS
jgi:DNA polymerase phi